MLPTVSGRTIASYLQMPISCRVLLSNEYCCGMMLAIYTVSKSHCTIHNRLFLHVENCDHMDTTVCSPKSFQIGHLHKAWLWLRWIQD